MDSYLYPSKYPISLCTFVRNEEASVGHMIKSVKDFVDEIVVLDTGSTDNTIQVITEASTGVPLKIDYLDPTYRESEDFSFAHLRNLVAGMATHPWILMLDADETLSHPERIESIMRSYCKAGAFPRRRWADLEMTQQVELEAYPDWQVRFYQNHTKHIWQRQLHEYFDGAPVDHIHDGPVIEHFQDVYTTPERKKEKLALYERLSIKAKVTVHGGKPI